MTIQAYRCLNCAAPLDSQNIDRHLGIIRCLHCNSIFDLTRMAPVNQRAKESLSQAEQVKPPIALTLPEGYEMQKERNRLHITKRWRGQKKPFSLLFGLMFACVWLVMVGYQITSLWSVERPLIVLFMIPFAVVGIHLLYKSVANIVNITQLQVDQSKVQIRHFPLPWYPAPSLSAHEIEQVFVKQRSNVHHKGKNNVTTQQNFEVAAALQDGRKVVLFKALKQLEHALYIEQQIEQFLSRTG